MKIESDNLPILQPTELDMLYTHIDGGNDKHDLVEMLINRLTYREVMDILKHEREHGQWDEVTQ